MNQVSNYDKWERLKGQVQTLLLNLKSNPQTKIKVLFQYFDTYKKLASLVRKKPGFQEELFLSIYYVWRTIDEKEKEKYIKKRIEEDPYGQEDMVRERIEGYYRNFDLVEDWIWYNMIVTKEDFRILFCQETRPFILNKKETYSEIGSVLREIKRQMNKDKMDDRMLFLLGSLVNYALLLAKEKSEIYEQLRSTIRDVWMSVSTIKRIRGYSNFHMVESKVLRLLDERPIDLMKEATYNKMIIALRTGVERDQVEQSLEDTIKRERRLR
jgi:hypothetical protein